MLYGTLYGKYQYAAVQYADTVLSIGPTPPGTTIWTTIPANSTIWTEEVPESSVWTTIAPESTIWTTI